VSVCVFLPSCTSVEIIRPKRAAGERSPLGTKTQGVCACVCEDVCV